MKRTLFVLSVSFCILITGCPAMDTDIIGDVISSKSGEEITTEEKADVVEIDGNEMYWGNTWTYNDVHQMRSDFIEWVKTSKDDEYVLFDRETYGKERTAWLENESKAYSYTVNQGGELASFGHGTNVVKEGDPKSLRIISILFDQIAHWVNLKEENGSEAVVHVKYNSEMHYPEAYLMLSWDRRHDPATDKPLPIKWENVHATGFNVSAFHTEGYSTGPWSPGLRISPEEIPMTESEILADVVVRHGLSSSELARFLGETDSTLTAGEIADVLVEAGLSGSNIADVLAQTRKRKIEWAPMLTKAGKTEKELAENLALVGVNEIVEALTRIGLSESEINDALARAGVSE